MADTPHPPNRIRELRQLRKLSQERLAVHAGLTRVTLAAIESSQERMQAASLATLEKIAAALGVTLPDLIPTLKTPPTKEKHSIF